MPNDTLTLVLTGEVPLADFAKAINGFMRMIKGLQEAVAGEVKLEWVVADLEAGSAIATVRGRPIAGDDFTPVINVVRAYASVAESFRQGIEPDFPSGVVSSVRDILSVLNGRVSSVRFETEESDAEITSESVELLSRPKHDVVAFVQPPRGPAMSYGSVRGRVQSITSRQRLRFTLYDANTDRPISCYLESGSEAQMREAWGRLTIVEGLVRRNATTGQPLTIRQVRSVIVLDEMEPSSWRRAIGAIPHTVGAVSSEEAVRRARDE